MSHPERNPHCPACGPSPSPLAQPAHWRYVTSDREGPTGFRGSDSVSGPWAPCQADGSILGNYQWNIGGDVPAVETGSYCYTNDGPSMSIRSAKADAYSPWPPFGLTARELDALQQAPNGPPREGAGSTTHETHRLQQTKQGRAFPLLTKLELLLEQRIQKLTDRRVCEMADRLCADVAGDVADQLAEGQRDNLRRRATNDVLTALLGEGS